MEEKEVMGYGLRYPVRYTNELYIHCFLHILLLVSLIQQDKVK